MWGNDRHEARAVRDVVLTASHRTRAEAHATWPRDLQSLNRSALAVPGNYWILKR